jgi:solute carrier family 35, member F1/2
MESGKTSSGESDRNDVASITASINQENETKLEHPRWKVLAFGQVLSFLMAIMWASQSTLFLTCKWNSPAFACLWGYILLSTFLIPICIKGRKMTRNDANSVHHWFLLIIPLQTTPWGYLGIAGLSFYGNYCYLLAVSYTTITSISLVDALAIPTTMTLSYFVLRRRYMRLHIIGATLCICGVLLGVTVDVVSNIIYNSHMATTFSLKTLGNGTLSSPQRDDGSQEYPHKLVGDLLACIGASLFGVSDVLAEYSVRRLGGTFEYLGMVGFFGACFSLFQISIFERETVSDMFHDIHPVGCSSAATAGLLVAYVIGQFNRKAGLAAFLTMADAAMLQLSLLTSDLYTALFTIFFQNIMPRNTSWVAMFLVLSGIAFYERGKTPPIDWPNAKHLEVHEKFASKETYDDDDTASNNKIV